MELLKVDTIEEAMSKLMAYGQHLPLNKEKVGLYQMMGRILAEDIVSRESVPSFPRSTVDGYAVRSKDTGGAGESIPAFLQVIGEVEMGKSADLMVGPGQCVYVPTGGMVPAGADAMVMVEYCEGFGQQMAIYSSVSEGNNMVLAGDDMKEGELILKKGRKLRAADLGVLAALGRTEVDVYQPWKVSILSTGDEIVSPEQKPDPGQVRDVNSYGLYGQAVEYGFQVPVCRVVEDDESLLREAVASAMETSDVVVISGGSSQGKKDATARIVDDLTSSGVFTHGIAIKPGKPTILGFDEGSKTAVIGLPGHPVAAMLLFQLLVGGLWKQVTELEQREANTRIRGIMASNVAASPGRRTYQLVTIQKAEGEGFPKIVPIRGTSGLIRTMSEADGYIILDVNDEGISRGEMATAYLWEK